MKKQIPNFLSFSNLISGTIVTQLALNGLVYAAYSIFVRACVDFLGEY